MLEARPSPRLRETSGLLIVAKKTLGAHRVARHDARGQRGEALSDPGAGALVQSAAARQGSAAQVPDRRRRSARCASRTRARRRTASCAPGTALARLQPARGGTEDRAHASDPRASCPSRLRAVRRRQIRRLRAQQAPEVEGLRRMFLHAAKLRFAHLTGAPLAFDSPLPADLQTFLDRLDAARKAWLNVST